jgi:hypothetical protein
MQFQKIIDSEIWSCLNVTEEKLAVEYYMEIAEGPR